MVMISKERNPQRITTPQECMNKQKIQTQVVITAIKFYFIFSYYTSFRLSLCHITQSQKKKEIIISKTYYVNGDFTGFNSELILSKGNNNITTMLL